MTRLASVDRPIEVRSERRPGWFWVDNEVIDNFGSMIGVAGVAVYCALARNAREGCCRFSCRTLAKSVGCSPQTVMRTIEVLVRCALIAVVCKSSSVREPSKCTLLAVRKRDRSSGEQSNTEIIPEGNGIVPVRNGTVPLWNTNKTEDCKTDISSWPSSDELTDAAILYKAVREIFDYYIQQIGRNPDTYSLTPLRRNMGVARLNECLRKTGGSLEKAKKLMQLAIEKLAASDWHMGRDPKTGGKRYGDWGRHLFNTYERMEEWWNA